jgi:hypothetical protein
MLKLSKKKRDRHPTFAVQETDMEWDHDEEIDRPLAKKKASFVFGYSNS